MDEHKVEIDALERGWDEEVREQQEAYGHTDEWYRGVSLDRLSQPTCAYCGEDIARGDTIHVLSGVMPWCQKCGPKNASFKRMRKTIVV